MIQISEALDRVARRFEGIHTADDFLVSEHGMDMLDAICMMLIDAEEIYYICSNDLEKLRNAVD